MSVIVEPTPELEELETPPRFGGGGGGGDDGGANGDHRDGGGGGGGGGEEEDEGDAANRTALVGIWVALAPIFMLFLAFISAYVVRQGMGSGWITVELPSLVWVNTAVLALSSWTLEQGRRQISRGNTWLLATLALGLLFVVGQIVAWQQLLERGVGMSTSPYSSFFYLLTGAHAVHLAGGLLGLAVGCYWPERGFRNLTRETAVKVAAIYWHFMGLLWLGLVLLFTFWR